VRSALEAAGVDFDALGMALNAVDEGDACPERAAAAFHALLSALPPAVHSYVATRAAGFATQYGKRYRALVRAERPIQMLAHNGAGFDNCALLDHLCYTDWLSMERAAMVTRAAVHGGLADGEVEVECVDGDAFAPLARGDDTTVLDTGKISRTYTIHTTSHMKSQL
jgi:hypothetical protein